MGFRKFVRALSGKRIPLIKFRKGGAVDVAAQVPALTPQPTTTPTVQSAQPAPTTPSKPVPQPAIEEWQLDHRYRRKIMEPEEIESINMGGPLVPGEKIPKHTAMTCKQSSGGLQILEDYELPERYARKDMEELEMEYVNMGGPPVPDSKSPIGKSAKKKK